MINSVTVLLTSITNNLTITNNNNFTDHLTLRMLFSSQ